MKKRNDYFSICWGLCLIFVLCLFGFSFQLKATRSLPLWSDQSNNKTIKGQYKWVDVLSQTTSDLKALNANGVEQSYLNQFKISINFKVNDGNTIKNYSLIKFTSNEIGYCVSEPCYSLDIAPFRNMIFLLDSVVHNGISYRDDGITIGGYLFMSSKNLNNTKITNYNNVSKPYENHIVSDSYQIIDFGSTGGTMQGYVYDWFMTVAEPVNKCYYVENKSDLAKSKFVWSNILGTGVEMPQYTDSDACSNAKFSVTLVTGDNNSNGMIQFDNTSERKYSVAPGTYTINNILDFTIVPPSGKKLDGWKLTTVNGVPVKEDLIYKSTDKFKVGTKVNSYNMYNLVFEAIYVNETICKYTVTYDANGGSGAPQPQTGLCLKNINLTKDIPTRDGYSFIGWNTKVDGSGTIYMPGASYPEKISRKLYAQWTKTDDDDDDDDDIVPCPGPEPCGPGETSEDDDDELVPCPGPEPCVPGATYRVIFKANGGTGAPAEQTKLYNVDLTLTSVVPSRTGYTFISWNTKADGSGTSYGPGGTYRNNATVTLYAQWIKGDNLSRCNIRDNPPTSDKMLVSIGLMILTFIGFGYFYFIVRRVKD